MSSLKATFLFMFILLLSTSCARQLESKDDEKTGELSYNTQVKRDDETKTESTNNHENQANSASSIKREREMARAADSAEIIQRSIQGRKAQPPGLWGRSLRNKPLGLWGRQATISEGEEKSDDEGKKFRGPPPGLWGRSLRNRKPGVWERRVEDDKNNKIREESENDILQPQHKPPGLWGREIEDDENYEDKSMKALTDLWERSLRKERPGLWGRGIQSSRPGLWGKSIINDPSESWRRQFRQGKLGLWGRALRNSPTGARRGNFWVSETNKDDDIDINDK